MQKLSNYVQKHRKIVYLLVAALIIIFSCYFGLHSQENWNAEKYGTTSDGKVEITEGTEIKVKFTISEDNFQGVFVRIAPDTKNFVNEVLEFSLMDDETDNIIAEYEMLLKNEAINTNAFAVLPYMNSKGKKVTLTINGADIKVTPYLITSDNSNVASKLYVDNILQEQALVFSGVYMYFTGITLKSFIKGGILLFLLALIYWWPHIYEDSVSLAGSKMNHLFLCDLKDRAHKIVLFVKKHKKAFVFLCFTFVYCCFTLFVYKCYVEEILEKRTDVNIVKESEQTERIVLDSNTRCMEQIFKAKKKNLSSVAYTIMVSQCDSGAMLHVIVQDAESEYCYHEDYVNVGKLPQGKEVPFEIFFQKEFTQSQDKQVKVILEPIDFGDTQLEVVCGEYTTKSTCMMNGQKLRMLPVLNVAYDNNDFFVKLFIGYVLLVYVFFCVVYYLLCIRRASIEDAFLPIAFLLGLIYMFAIPVYVVPDENAHVDTAYAISNSILGVQDSDRVNYLWKRASDIETEYSDEHDGKMYMYRRLYSASTDIFASDVLEECYGSNAISNASVFFYLPAAIGLTVARLFHLGTYYTLLMGRLFNLLAYISIVYLGIKKLPLKKVVLSVIATLPISMQQAASFSYDGILNGLAFLFLGYCFYFILTREKIKNCDVVILMTATMLMAYVKGGVYMPLCFLLILIPIEREWKIKSYLYFIITSLFVLCSYMQQNMEGMMKRAQVLKAANVDPFTGKVNYTISQALKYPLTTILVLVNTFFNRGDDYVKGFMGGNLGSLNYSMMWINVIIVIGVLFYLSNGVDGKRVFKKKRSYILTLILLLGSVGLILLSMLIASTPVDNSFVIGVQGRYFIPLGLIPFLLCGSLFTPKVSENKVLLVFYVNQIVMLLYIVMIVSLK